MSNPLSAFAIGAARWPFFEYLIHRFLFHGPNEDSPEASQHLHHHRHPDEYNDFTLPDAYQEIASFAPQYTAALLAGLTPVVGLANATAWVAGLWTGIALYETEHIRAHNQGPGNARQARLIKHHLAHHFTHPRANHGVTTTLFDRLFGTYEEPPTPLPVPAVFAPKWLLQNPEKWAADYKLLGRDRAQSRRKKSA